MIFTTCGKLCKISFDFNNEPLTKLSSVVGLKSERKDLNAFTFVNYGDRKQETHSILLICGLRLLLRKTRLLIHLNHREYIFLRTSSAQDLNSSSLFVYKAWSWKKGRSRKQK